MEKKLREYRALRRRNQLIDNTKETLENTKQKVIGLLTPKFLTDMDKGKKEEEVLLMDNEEPISKQELSIQYDEPIEEPLEISETEIADEVENPESWQYFIMKWTIYTMIWLTLWIFFLMQGFGAVYFACSILVGICLNTSVRRRKPGEASAYSVFNRNCESIDGTLKAEELQRQMMFGLGGINLF